MSTKFVSPRLYVLAGLILVLMMVACSGPQDVSGHRQSSTISTPPVSQVSTPALIADVTAEPEEQFQTTEIALKTSLEATDPAEVQLESGNLQLVEFFAFW